MSNSLSLIFALSLLILGTQQSIKERNFIELSPYEFTHFTLKKDNFEYYFSFTNNHNEGEISLNLPVGTGRTVNCYIYKSLKDVKQNEKGEYIDYEWIFNFGIKHHRIENPVNGTLYIVIQDSSHYFYEDYLQIFNELDQVPLKNGKSFEIFQFFSTKKYTFNITAENDDIVLLNIESMNKERKGLIEIKHDTEVIYNTTEIDIQSYPVKSANVGGSKSYTVTIYSEDSHKENRIRVVAYIRKSKLIQLNPDVEVSIDYVNKQKFIFFADIDNYEENEENTVSLILDYYAKEEKLLSDVFGAIITTSNTTDENLMQLIPDKSNSTILKDYEDDSDTYYHIYFKNIKKGEQKRYLLLTLTLDSSEFITQKNLHIGLSSPIIRKTLSGNEVDTVITESIQTYIPKYYQFTLPLNKNQSYVFYCDEDQTMTVFNSTLLKYNEINPNFTKKQIFALNKDQEDVYRVYTIRLFGPKKNITLRYETTESYISYYNSFRPLKKIQKEITDCSSPFYIIGTYEEYTKNYLYIDELYGKFKLLYKTNFNISEKILPVTTNITEKFLSVDTNFEIIGVQCEYPGVFDMYIINDSFPEKLEYGSQVVKQIEKSTTKEIKFKDNINTVNLILSSPLGVEIDINIGELTVNLGPEKISESLQLNKTESDPAFTMQITTKNESGIINIEVGNNNKYVKKEKGASDNKDNIFYFELEESSNYKYAQLEINYIESGVSYQILDIENINYLPLLSKSGMDIKLESDAIIKISNPYEKERKSSTSKYALAVQVTSGTSLTHLNFTYFEKEKYEPSEPKVLKKLESGMKLGLPKNDTAKNLSILAHSCNRNNTIKEYLYLNYYDDVVNSAELNSKYFGYLSLPNYKTELQVSSTIENGTYNGVMLSYIYDEYDFQKISKYISGELKLEVKGNNVKWEGIKDLNISYKVYVFEEGAVEESLIDNYCYVTSLKEMKSSNLRDSNSTYKIIETKNTNYKISEYKKGTVNVLAMAEDGLQIHYLYGTAKFGESKNSYLWIMIAGPIVVVFIIILIFLLLRKKKRDRVSNVEQDALIPNSDN